MNQYFGCVGTDTTPAALCACLAAAGSRAEAAAQRRRLEKGYMMAADIHTYMRPNFPGVAMTIVPVPRPHCLGRWLREPWLSLSLVASPRHVCVHR